MTATLMSAKATGRIVGLLLLVQVLLAIPVYTEIGMMRAVIAPGFLENAAADALQIRAAVLLTHVLSGLALAVALITLPLFRQRMERLALLFLSLSILGLAMQTVEGITVRDMVAMSVAYAKPDAERAVLETLGVVARSSWGSAHFFNLALGHVKLFIFFLILFRGRYVPKLLSGAGLAATVVSTTAATIALLGLRFRYPLVAPAAIIQLIMVVYLLFKGFSDDSQPSA
ncbi:MAG TPA: DUF4386 family protein [Thermoanaerobaculia bacterium]|nr:DUF4386 family protein [Thermoanaerobaculia bacterium]